MHHREQRETLPLKCIPSKKAAAALRQERDIAFVQKSEMSDNISNAHLNLLMMWIIAGNIGFANRLLDVLGDVNAQEPLNGQTAAHVV